MSRTVKLVVMGVAGAALLYSCAPGIGGGLGALPYLWFLSNPFFRGGMSGPVTPGPSATTTNPGTAATPGQQQPSTRGGFGGSAGQYGTTGAS